MQSRLQRTHSQARAALVGNRGLSKQQARAALALSNGRDVAAISAIAAALAGDTAQAVRLASDRNQRFPQDTVVQFDYLPMIRAASILGGSDASKDAGEAIQALAKAEPYELGGASEAVEFFLYPVYLRGEAYLAARQGAAAAGEFEKILNHPGIALNEPIAALAHVGLGRAYAVEAGLSRHGENGGVKPPLQHGTQVTAGETPALQKARTAYQDFFALWKNADPDIPILKQAKAEYTRLH